MSLPCLFPQVLAKWLSVETVDVCGNYGNVPSNTSSMVTTAPVAIEYSFLSLSSYPVSVRGGAGRKKRNKKSLLPLDLEMAGFFIRQQPITQGIYYLLHNIEIHHSRYS